MKKVLITLIAVFAICGSIFAQQYESHWPGFNMYAYEDHTDLFARVQIDGDFVGIDNYEALEVAAFVDGELRGATFMSINSALSDPVYVMARVYVNYRPDINKVATFKLYDHASGYEYEVYTSDRVIEAVPENMFVYQDINNPVILSFFHSYTKEITPYTDNGGYYFIASPIGDVQAKNVENLMSNSYDFYSFDQEQDLEWINHRGEENYVLQPGMGYLYANSGNGTDNPVVLTFIGAPYDGNGEVTLVKKTGGNIEFSGWNLVGNPFAEKAYITKSFYTLNGTGSEVVAGEGNEVGAMEGIFVVAENDGETMTFSTESNPGKGQIVLNVNQDRSDVIDRAIVRFGGDKLPKFMLNPNNTKMYITKDNNDYAVVNGSNNGKLPVSFIPAQDGRYTINVNVEDATVRYLHLIDRMTGMDTDLLVTPSYSFDAKTIEKPNRFVLVFRRGISLVKDLSVLGNNNGFGFFSNGNWIINNEGDAILQVVDVNGQILSSEEINGSVSKHIEAAPGVYMLRLINGKDMKVQKIVVE